MVKVKTIFICDKCGNETPTWSGKCFSCGAWNTLKEVAASLRNPKSEIRNPKQIQNLNDIKLNQSQRIKTGIFEFDRTLGGGIVPGSLILLAGEPGIGKSTLLLQIAEGIKNTLYVSGEESSFQIKMRADRLSIKSNFLILDEIEIENIIAAGQKEKPALLIIDSIQTMYDGETETSAGSVTQVKAVGFKLQQFAKMTNTPVIMIGHITKSGAVAGPRTLEHLVDTVLYFEGDKYHGQRILRATKNRFGSTFESGVFEMTAGGLKEVKNPSAIFVDNELPKAPGSAATVSIEGSRPFIFEVQALCPHSSFGYAKRTASGIDLSRIQLLSAVVTEHTKVNLQHRDIYVNLVGGVKVREPAIDLAICAALISAARKKALPKESIFMGEVGLTGEIREASLIEKRVVEANRQGYTKIYIPRTRKIYKGKGVKMIQLSALKELERLIIGP